MNSAAASLMSLLLAAPANECYKNCIPSDDGIRLISSFEGYSPFSYEDVVGVRTLGFGHAIKRGEHFKEPLLPPDAYTLLKSDANISGKAVNRSVGVPLRQTQFDAVNSFTFNLGAGSLAKSTMLKRINAKRHKDVPGEMLKWNKAGGEPVRGLTLRRETEGALYAK